MPAPPSLEALEEAVQEWQADGIACVVSLLDIEEIPGFTELESHLCMEVGIDLVAYPIPDKSVPVDNRPFIAVARSLAKRIASGEAVAIHCRAGIGRSTMLTAAILVISGIPPPDALDMIAEARGVEVPETEAQRQWILALEDLVSGAV